MDPVLNEPYNLQLYRSCLPLEIPCILNQILKHLPHQDLQKSRLVSKQFNEEACRVLRKRSKIVLNSPKRFIAFNLEMLKSLEENRYCEHFQLINVHVSSPAVLMFLQKFGSCIKSFDLKDSKWSCQQLTTMLTDTLEKLDDLIIHGPIPKDSPRLFMKEGTEEDGGGRKGEQVGFTAPKLPKIKQLDLQLYDKAADEEVLKDFGTDLLKAAINLEVLQSRDTGKWKNRREKFQRILFELLIDQQANIVLPKLKKIQFPLSPWNDEQVRHFQGKFPLNYLSLTILPDITSTALFSLLRSLKDTLRKLKLSFTSWRVTIFPCDMELTALQHLSLDWFNGSVSFISKLKSLQTLILAQADLNELFTDVEIAKFDKPHEILSKVEVYQPSVPAVLPSAVINISKIFPNVKTLVIGKLSDASLRCIFSSLPLLEEFSAIEGTFTDFGVTGIDPELCGVCRNEHLPELCKGIYDEELVNRRKKHSHVANLTHLRKLVLKSPHLTNMSVIHGIAFCQRLKSLSLWSYEMNFKSLKKLVDTFKLNYLESTHTFSHIAEIRYALSAMQGKKFILNGIVAPTFSSIISPEARDFISQFHDNVCRSIISQMKQRTSPPFDHDIAVYHNKRHQQQNLFLIYEACMAEHYALQGLMDISNSG